MTTDGMFSLRQLVESIGEAREHGLGFCGTRKKAFDTVQQEDKDNIYYASRKIM